MKSAEYRLIEPKKIEKSAISLPEPAEREYLVKVTHTQVCDADAKYYFGLKPSFYRLLGFDYFYGIRDKKKFMGKYPLILLHEAVGVVEKAGPETKLTPGTRVVLIPSIPCKDPKCRYCSSGRENYCVNSRFMSSDAPGFARTHIIMPERCLAKIPTEVPTEVAAYTEMATVAYGGINVSNLTEEDSVAVFGDGYLGFVLSALLSKVFRVPEERLWVFGVHDDKLSKFSDFSTTVNTRKQSIPEGIEVNKIFECVGKRNAGDVINTAIRFINPEGVIVLLGVSEEKVDINTRDLLSKSVTLRGVSRSPARFYPRVLDLMRNQELQELIRRIVSDSIRINSARDIEKSLEEFMVNRRKMLMVW